MTPLSSKAKDSTAELTYDLKDQKAVLDPEDSRILQRSAHNAMARLKMVVDITRNLG